MNITHKQTVKTLYQLDALSHNETWIANVVTFVRLLEVQITLFDQEELALDVKKAWLLNIMITTSSLIETYLKETLIVLRHKIHIMNGNQDFELDTNLTYQQIIEKNIQFKMLNIEETYLQQIRYLRNNIHLDKLTYPIETDKRFALTKAKQYINLFFLVTQNVMANFNKFFA